MIAFEPIATPPVRTALMPKNSLDTKLNTYTSAAFDYAVLTTDVADQARGAAERIRNYQRAASLEIGRELLTLKEALGHGHFGKWIEAEFGWTARSAQNFMQVAIAFGDAAKYETVSYLPASTIYQLAADSTPEDVRDAVVRAAAAGRRTTPQAVKVIMSEARSRDVRKERKAREKNPSPEDQAKEVRRQQREARQRARSDAEREANSRRMREAARIIRDALGEQLSTVQEMIRNGQGYELVIALLAPAEPHERAAA